MHENSAQKRSRKKPSNKCLLEASEALLDALLEPPRPSQKASERLPDASGTDLRGFQTPATRSQGAAVVSPLGLCDPPPPSSSLPRAGAGREGSTLSTREVLSHRLPPFRRPRPARQTFGSFFVFFFDIVSGPLLNAYFSLLKPQNLPKWSPNPPKIEPKTLPKSILCCERRKMISSKRSHTFAHFCISRGLQNRPEIAP